MNEDINIQKKPSRRKYIIAAGFILLLITCALVFSMFQQEQKNGAESDRIILEAAAELLDMDPNYFIENDYFDKVYSLNLSHMPIAISQNYASPNYAYVSIGSKVTPIFGLVEISDIQYIEKFPNLEYIDLKICFPRKEIPKWMIYLSKLGVLDLNKRFLIDLKPLANLHHLRIVNLTGSQVKDIKPLENLNELERLEISYTQVKNIKPVKNLINLRYLDISNTEVSNIEPVGKLVNLERLILNDTEVSNLESLKKIKHLLKLEIRNCKKISDDQVKDLQKSLPYLEIVR